MHHTRLNIYSKLAVQRHRLERQMRLEKSTVTQASRYGTTIPNDEGKQADVDKGKDEEPEPDIPDLSNTPKVSMDSGKHSNVNNSFYDLDLSLGSMAALTDQSLLGYVTELASELSLDKSMLDQSHVAEGSLLNTPVKESSGNDAVHDPWLPTDTTKNYTYDSRLEELPETGLSYKRELSSYGDSRYEEENERVFQPESSNYERNGKVLENLHSFQENEESTDDSSDDIPTDDEYVSTSEFSDSGHSDIPLDVPVIKIPTKDNVTISSQYKPSVNSNNNPDCSLLNMKAPTDFSIRSMLSDVVTRSQSVNPSVPTQSNNVIAPSKPASQSVSSQPGSTSLSFQQRNSSADIRPLQASATFPPVQSPMMFHVLPLAMRSQPSFIPVPVTSHTLYASSTARPLLVPQNNAFSNFPRMQGAVATANNIFTSYKQFPSALSLQSQGNRTSGPNTIVNFRTSLNTRFPLPNISFSASSQQIFPNNSIVCKSGDCQTNTGIQQIASNFQGRPMISSRYTSKNPGTKRIAQKGRKDNGQQHQTCVMPDGSNSLTFTQRSATIQQRFMYQEGLNPHRIPYSATNYVPISGHVQQHLSISNVAIQTHAPFIENIRIDGNISRFPILPLNIGVQTFQTALHSNNHINSGKAYNTLNHATHFPVEPVNIQVTAPLPMSLLSTSNTSTNMLSKTYQDQTIHSYFQKQSTDPSNKHLHNTVVSTSITDELPSSASYKESKTLDNCIRNPGKSSVPIARYVSEHERYSRHGDQQQSSTEEKSSFLHLKMNSGSTEGVVSSQNVNAIDLCSSSLSSTSVDGISDSNCDKNRERISSETESCFSSDSYEMGLSKTTYLENQSDQSSHTDSLDVCPDVSHHRSISQYLHQCSVCSKGYCRKVDLDLHQLTHTFVLPKVENHVNIVNLLHKCEKCGFGFSRRSDYYEHRSKECSSTFEKENESESTKRKHSEEKDKSNSDDVKVQPPVKRKRGRPRKYPESEDNSLEMDKITTDKDLDKRKEKLEKEVSKLKECTEERRRGRPKVRKGVILGDDVGDGQEDLQDNLSQTSMSQNSSEEDNFNSKVVEHHHTLERQSKKTAKVAISMNYERRNTKRHFSTQRSVKTLASVANEREPSIDLNNNYPDRMNRQEEKHNGDVYVHVRKQHSSHLSCSSTYSDISFFSLNKWRQQTTERKYGHMPRSLKTAKSRRSYVSLLKYRRQRKLPVRIRKVLFKRIKVKSSDRNIDGQLLCLHRQMYRKCKDLSNSRADLDSGMLKISPLHRYDLRRQ